MGMFNVWTKKLAKEIATNIEAASTVTVADTANRYTGTNVETCLAEIAGASRTTETVKGNNTLITDHIADTADAHDASAISVLDTANRYTATDVEAALAEIAGAGRTTETVKDNATNIATNTTAISKLNGMYAIEFVGADADEAAAYCGTISVLTTGAVPVAGDYIVAIISARATADSSPVAFPAVVDANTSNGIVKILKLDGATVKVEQGVGSDLDANTYRALVLRV